MIFLGYSTFFPLRVPLTFINVKLGFVLHPGKCGVLPQGKPTPGVCQPKAEYINDADLQ